MKSAKKILALILAGVMALALLTGCGKSTSLNRTMAEGIADYFKSSCVQVGNKNNISLSYQVPELNRDIAPLFDENWITHDDSSGSDSLASGPVVNGETIGETLMNILSPYLDSGNPASAVTFRAADVTDVKTPFMETSNLTQSTIACSIFGTNSSTFNPASVTSLKIAVTHKTVNGRTYTLAVIIME